jgi:tetratricopeptide (TPR) repeat protein
MLRSPSWPLIPVAAALLSVAVVVSSPSKSRRQVVAAGVKWHVDLDTAMQIARGSGKETRDQMRDPELTTKDRHWLEDREAFNLGRLGRRDEARAIIDRWIVEADDDRNQRRIAFQDKGQFHFGKEWREAATAFETAADLSDDGSEEWWQNKGLAAWAWLLGKHYEEAKQTHAKMLGRSDLAGDFKPHLLLRLIESLLALGERDQANELRSKFQQAVADCPKDLLAAEDTKWLLSRCEQLFSETNKSDARPAAEQ